MTDEEMLDLDSTFEHIGYWRIEEQVQRITEDYMRTVWRQLYSSGRSEHTYRFPAMSMSARPPKYVQHFSSRRLHLRVPDALSEPTARLLIAAQAREQLLGEYDPRHRDEDD